MVLPTNNLPTASQCCLLAACPPHLGAPADAMPSTAEAISDHFFFVVVVVVVV